LLRLYKLKIINKINSKTISKLKSLESNPFKKGVVMRARILTPKKPNSARRPIAKIVTNSFKRITAHIPGIGHNLRRHSSVLVRGGGARDLPGVSYTCIRGVFDLSSVQNRLNRRSIYGISRPESNIKKLRRKFRSL
jgi:small subunit ribosomal protein S12